MTTDPKITLIQDILSAWAGTIPNHPYQDFGQNVAVTSVEEHPTYVIHLRSLYDIRTAPAEFVKPYQEEQLPLRPAESAPVDVWSHAVGLKPDFTEAETTVTIPSSLKVSPCLRCVGEAKGPCDRCSGYRMTSCADCKGRGRKSCEVCQGKGKFACATCNGSGSMLVSASAKGRQEEPCVSCMGTGGSSCSHCKNGSLECPSCQGKAKVSCPKCQGQGILPCPECQGRGQMLKGLSFKVTYHPSFERRILQDPAMPKELFPKELPWERLGQKVFDQEADFIDVPKEGVLPQAVFPLLLELLKKAQNAIQGFSSPARLAKQYVYVEKIPAFSIRYSFLNKEYACWAAPLGNRVLSEENPFTDLAKTWVREAQESLLQGDTDQAQQQIAKASSFLKEDNTLEETKKMLDQAWKKDFEKKSFRGALAAVSGFVLLFALGNHRSHHLFWPLALFFVAAGGLSVLAAKLTLKKMPDRILSIPQKRRWMVLACGLGPAFVSALFFMTAQPARRGDQREFDTLMEKWFPGRMLPLELQPKDKTFLKLIVETYGPLKVDVSAARKALDLQAQREEAARLKAIEDEKIRLRQAQERAQAELRKKQQVKKPPVRKRPPAKKKSRRK